MTPADHLPPLELGPGFSLLAGVSVLDLTTSIAGPYASLQLADFGAEIIKIERPGAGDDSRQWGPPFLDGESLWFLSVNRNKRSVALDIAQPSGQRILNDLVKSVDVVISNQLLPVQRKLGIDYDALARIKPDLIHVSITGFGLTGARTDWACYDLIAEGYSGIMDLTGAPDSEPQKIGTPAADLLAGMDAALATVAALYARRQDGRGRQIDVSLVESMSRFLPTRMVAYLGTGDVPRRSGAKDSVVAVYQIFQTADEPLTLGLGTDAIWKRFWQALDQPGRGDDVTTASNAQRRARRAELVADIQAILRTRPRAQWLALFAKARVPAGPINRLDETAADPHLIERGLFYRLAGSEPAIPQVNTGIRVDDRYNQPRCAPPRLGQDTETVLRERLGLSDATLAKLKADRII